jgi:hypothetical protein
MKAGKPEPGAQPVAQFQVDRRGIAAPHIRRQSRKQMFEMTFRAKLLELKTASPSAVGSQFLTNFYV